MTRAADPDHGLDFPRGQGRGLEQAADHDRARHADHDHERDADRDLERSLVFICQGPSCGERGGHQLARWLRSWIGACEARLRLRVCETTCLDHCPTGPNVAVQEERGVRTGVVGEDAARALFDELHETSRPVTGS